MLGIYGQATPSMMVFSRADGASARFLGGVTRTLNISYLKAVPISKSVSQQISKKEKEDHYRPTRSLHSD